ncbi:MAG: serine hydrolase [Planctomycetota bacterium]
MSDAAQRANEQIAEVVAGRVERVGYAVATLDDGEVRGERLDEVFTQASAIKIPIVWRLDAAAEAGELSLDEVLPVAIESGSGGCGVLQHFTPGVSQLTLGDIAVLMIVLSDNVATNLLIERVGMDRVNEQLESLGLEQTRLRRLMMDAAAREAGYENTSTPREAARLMGELSRQADSGDAAATRTLATLRLRKESPFTEALYDRSPIPELACKPGMLDGVRTEWSLVETGGNDGAAYTLCVMAEGGTDRQLKTLLEDAAAACFEAMTA